MTVKFSYSGLKKNIFIGDSLVELLIVGRVFGPFALLNNFHKVPQSFGLFSACVPLHVTSEVPLLDK